MEGSPTAPQPLAGMSLATRALIAVSLTVGFYALAIVVALALAIGIPAAEVSLHRANVFLTVAGIAIAVTILRAIIPRRHAFVAPGPELTAAEQPELHALLTEVAHKAGEDAADHVYADLDVNAGVLEHRRRRMLVIGLPLLATMDIDELRSVVAHEYGHYRAGDTRFGVWIWRTRAAVSETVYALSTTESVFRRVVRIPFDAYADLFLRITNAISRRAEFVADQVSAEVAGPEAAGRALRRFVAVGGVYDEYWEDDVVPLLEAQRCPPIVAGLTAVTAHLHLTGSLDDLVGFDIDDHEPDPYESHPTLRQRLEALGVEVTAAVPPPVPFPRRRCCEISLASSGQRCARSSAMRSPDSSPPTGARPERSTCNCCAPTSSPFAAWSPARSGMPGFWPRIHRRRCSRLCAKRSSCTTWTPARPQSTSSALSS